MCGINIGRMSVNLTRQTTFWAAMLALLFGSLWLLHEILLPFVAGMVLAYLLNPLVNRLGRLGVSRFVATLIIVSVFVLALLILIMFIAPIVLSQLLAFVDKVPGYVVRLHALATGPNWPWLRNIVEEGFPNLDQSIGDLMKQGVGWIGAFMRSLWSGGRSLISIFSLIVVTPVVAFYLINDWNRMIAAVDGWVPRPYRDTVRALAVEIDLTLAGFIRGQSAVCIILGLYYAIALTLTGLNFGLLIGLGAGLITFIPYVGSLTGLVLAVGVAVAQFWPDYVPILKVLGVFLVGQFAEGNVLSPKLVGESVGLHPVWLIFALFAFGYLFGFVGLLLAVPLAAAFGVLTRFALRQYLASPFYTGAEERTRIGFHRELD
jgi:predicted PurR-regulated permease PerM